MRALTKDPCEGPAGALSSTTVRVWSVGLDTGPTERERLAETLSDGETARAARIRLARNRERFVVAHGALRQILASYLGRSPASLELGLRPRGKPFVETVPGEVDLRFSLSHSHDRALVAVAVGREVGVDIERVDERIELLPLARRFFAPEEVAELQNLPPSERLEGFFRTWTLKEAYVKALGAGLHVALDGFAVSPASAGPPRLLRSDREDRASWTLQTLAAADGYAAAVVVEGARISVRRHSLSLRSA